jgi:hypothetical protein
MVSNLRISFSIDQAFVAILLVDLFDDFIPELGDLRPDISLSGFATEDDPVSPVLKLCLNLSS